MKFQLLGVLSFAGLVMACAPGPKSTAPVSKISPEARKILSAADNNAEWLTYGRTYAEQRFSPLSQINQDTVKGLKLEWYADLDTARGQEATPLVIDGTMYLTTAWSKVKAYNAATGQPVWDFDPEVPGATGAKACCDVVNRGLASWGDKLFFGTLDGRLIALDRNTGEPVWTTQTFDKDSYHTITGAPRVVNGMVLIGNGGADMGSVRGYVSAYDAETGDLKWRFYTVPDNPANGPQPAYLEQAAETWTGDWWELGGGGTVWDAMAYDPDLDLLYIGVGNGAPWNQQFRSPEGGDNLYLSSIVAIHAQTGDYAWHFQTTPGETWDFTATQHIMLADIEIDGVARKVLMQAPKNGFFYVLDRETGEFISASNYTNVTWAKGIDPKTGRPVENPDARYLGAGPALVFPSALGGHNWHPMAFHPDEGLVYIPVHNVPQPYSSPDTWSEAPLGWNNALGGGPQLKSGSDAKVLQRPAPEKRVGMAPQTDTFQPVEQRKRTAGSLVAWDPVTQTERWQVPLGTIWNGGVLATGGDLVFQGTALGEFRAYNAATGEQLWSFPTQTGVIAAPMTFELGGKQHVAVMSGWGGVFGLLAGVVPNRSRILVFSLDGTAELPPAETFKPVADPPLMETDPAKVADGAKAFRSVCVTCHAGGSVIPDLRYSGALEREDTWLAVVRDGALEDRGMVSFSPLFTDDQLLNIREYLVSEAQKLAEKQN